MRANEMGDLDYSTQSMDNLRVGLCVTCKYIRVVSSDRGSYFVMCNLARQDKKYDKYPVLPVLSCNGHAIAVKPDD